jgi:hypothetical protein
VAKEFPGGNGGSPHRDKTGDDLHFFFYPLFAAYTSIAYLRAETNLLESFFFHHEAGQPLKKSGAGKK